MFLEFIQDDVELVAIFELTGGERDLTGWDFQEVML
jgi:hypothetical protein